MALESAYDDGQIEPPVPTNPQLITSLGELGYSLAGDRPSLDIDAPHQQIPAGEFQAEAIARPPEYATNYFIKSDLRRLKAFKSLADDLQVTYEQVCVHLYQLGGMAKANFKDPFITNVTIAQQSFNCHRTRMAITEPHQPASNGCRLIYGISQELFVPLLVFRVTEKGACYGANKDKLLLIKNNFRRIIQAKIDKAGPDFSFPNQQPRY